MPEILTIFTLMNLCFPRFCIQQYCILLVVTRIAMKIGFCKLICDCPKNMSIWL